MIETFLWPYVHDVIEQVWFQPGHLTQYDIYFQPRFSHALVFRTGQHSDTFSFGIFKIASLLEIPETESQLKEEI